MGASGLFTRLLLFPDAAAACGELACTEQACSERSRGSRSVEPVEGIHVLQICFRQTPAE
jgi:hypothetical protein